MWKNTLKIAYRNLVKQRLYSTINILGLAIGLCATILILLFVKDELSYDKYHEDHDRIYRVSREWLNQDGTSSLHLGHTAPPFAPLLKSDFGEIIEESVRLLNTDVIARFDDKVFPEEKFFFADHEVFKVFSWKMLQGDPNTVLNNPDGLVITESTAKKYFGEMDPMGKQMEIQIGTQRQEMMVRGIIEDVPRNSHFTFDMLASFKPVELFYGGYEPMMQNFGNNAFSTFIKLKKEVTPTQLSDQLPAFMDRHLPANSQGIPASTSTRLHLWPLKDIHLHSNLASEIEPNSNIEYVYIYFAIALFILFIACINFMNLSTAKSANRAMEVGLRKVMGANKGLLIKQFIGESMIMACLALVLAVLFTYLFLEPFSQFTGKEFSLNFVENPQFALYGLGLVLLVGLISGSYPAFFLSGFEPVNVMKGTYKIGSIHEKLRSVLVVFQFAIAISLIACLIIVTNQLEYMKTKDLGYQKDHVVILPAPPALTQTFEMNYNRLIRHPGITDLALASRVPSSRLLDSQGATAELNGEMIPINFRIADVHVSHTFQNTLGIELAAGRDFDIEKASDSLSSFILNENAVRAIGWSSAEEAIQKQFNYGNRQGVIVGVYEDFHFESLHQPIVPIVFMIAQNRFNEVAIRVHPDQFDEAIGYLNTEWLAMNPGTPFQYSMIEDRLLAQYESDEKIQILFGTFSGLAIFISILGLLGMASFTTQQRFREIGIRKILGASVLSIITLLEKEFLKLIFWGLLISLPVVWYGMSAWLDQFSFHIPMSLIPMLIAGVTALIIAMVTISVLSWKAATVNPVESIKTE